ncbi:MULTISPECIES: hypothetical protein [Paenibacillus]|jgi:hypothetical protein|uniref:Uncharacterized protein n=6 Tax=Paenibacillus TaxID=44249 RepID=G4HQ72_9BACL|nr:hypothetical protein [Paenibacillus lactis]EHB45761.1 hypothetical protein PaelaDRAFT_6133 [Paenibacillus lactis 154]MBP1893272.1 hypothetical protein [Paenibacillus lactis]MCM3496407.1 hypothetical protein [Paenibacillus lactis]HAG01466.1 hypothetical protein [Paenibacillus lactis]
MKHSAGNDAELFVVKELVSSIEAAEAAFREYVSCIQALRAGRTRSHESTSLKGSADGHVLSIYQYIVEAKIDLCCALTGNTKGDKGGLE